MRARMPLRRPSPAMVVALLALFVALGGTAMAAFVVSSNSQIGPGTVAGAKPPSGAHSNIIAGSINGSDLATNSIGSSRVIDGILQGVDVRDGSLTGADVKDDSLTGADVDESTLGRVPSAANADTLGGHGPSEFVQGDGRLATIVASVGFDGSGTLLDMPGFARVSFFCNGDGTGQYAFASGPASVGVFFDNGGADPNFLSIDPNSSAGSSFWAVKTLDGVTISLSAGDKAATLVLFNRTFRNIFTRQSFCRLQGQALVHGG